MFQPDTITLSGFYSNLLFLFTLENITKKEPLVLTQDFTLVILT